MFWITRLRVKLPNDAKRLTPRVICSNVKVNRPLVVLDPAIGRIQHRQDTSRLRTLAHLDAASQNLVLSTRTNAHRYKYERTLECVKYFYTLHTQLAFTPIRIGNRQQCRPRRKLHPRAVALDAKSFPDE